MRILVVGGHSRGVGKTALIVDLIRAFPDAAWTAVKISQHVHGVCILHGAPCECTPATAGTGLDEERDSTGLADSCRFLAAGAAHAFWLRTPPGELADGVALLRQALGNAENVIVESNSILEHVRPQLYLVILDPAQPDFKPSSLRYLDRADAFVLRSALAQPTWPGVNPHAFEETPVFLQPLGDPLSPDLREFVAMQFWK